ncbi:hypothetical protein Tco_1334081 [Tanacetum coccineum]
MSIRRENRQAKQLTFTIRKIVIDMWISYSLVTTIPGVLSSVGKGYERSNTQSPLLQELARVADSRDIRDQLSVIFRREVFQDSQKMRDYYRLSNEITEAVRMRDEYMKELQTVLRSDDVGESVEIMRRMQVDDMEAVSRLMLMATEMQMKYAKIIIS